MNFSKLKINTVILFFAGLIFVSFISVLVWPDIEDSPWHSDQYTTQIPSRIMAERWPHPEPNDPNFLADFRYYMGFDFHNPDAP